MGALPTASRTTRASRSPHRVTQLARTKQGFREHLALRTGRLDSCARLLPLVHSPSPVAHVHIGISASGKTL
ncbi:hypothetical protein L210DRAFT_940955, partial [Boletus edulis BED1]